MKEPTKADLAAAVARLTEENAGLRDLLAAITECAEYPPISKHNDYRAELRRAERLLCMIKVTANPAGAWAWGHVNGKTAAQLRATAAEDPGYEVSGCEEAELVALKQEMDPPVTGCAEVDDGYICNGHEDGHHVAYGPDGEVCHRWPAAAPAAAPAAGLVGRIVADATDDSPVPLTGRIVGQVDEETVEVLWGEHKYAESPICQPSREPIDALRPVTA